jgi:hypothetical protein
MLIKNVAYCENGGKCMPKILETKCGNLMLASPVIYKDNLYYYQYDLVNNKISLVTINLLNDEKTTRTLAELPATLAKPNGFYRLDNYNFELRYARHSVVCSTNREYTRSTFCEKKFNNKMQEMIESNKLLARHPYPYQDGTLYIIGNYILFVDKYSNWIVKSPYSRLEQKYSNIPPSYLNKIITNEFSFGIMGDTIVLVTTKHLYFPGLDNHLCIFDNSRISL